MSTLVTGSRGFLGSAMCAGLEALPYHRFQRENPQYIEGVGRVFHLASLVAYQPEDSTALFDGNVALTQWLANTYSQARMVFASSVSVYGAATSTSITEDTLPCASGVYGISKLWAEQFVKRLSSYGIVRFSSLYGPGMKETTLIPNYVRQAFTKGEIEVWGKGTRGQNYLHVSDAVALLLAAMQSSQKGIFLGTDIKEYSNLEVAEIIALCTGAKIRFVKEDNSSSVSYNNQTTRNTLNWTPETSLETGIRKYIEWKRKEF